MALSLEEKRARDRARKKKKYNEDVELSRKKGRERYENNRERIREKCRERYHADIGVSRAKERERAKRRYQSRDSVQWAEFRRAERERYRKNKDRYWQVIRASRIQRNPTYGLERALREFEAGTIGLGELDRLYSQRLQILADLADKKQGRRPGPKRRVSRLGEDKDRRLHREGDQRPNENKD